MQVETCKRNGRGTTLTEFGPALAIFVIFVLIPLLDCGFIPVRYGIAYGVINHCTYRLSLAEKMSDAQKLLGDTWWTNLLIKSGVGFSAPELSLRIVNKNDQEQQIVIPEPAPIPKEWQPDSKNGPFIYYLQMNVHTQIAPLFTMNLPWKGVPGLTAPAPIDITACSAWENYGRNPDTGEYFMNE